MKQQIEDKIVLRVLARFNERSQLGIMKYNTTQMIRRLSQGNTTCPQNRNCDSGIRTLQPSGDYYSCGAFGDDNIYKIDFEKEMSTYQGQL